MTSIDWVRSKVGINQHSRATEYFPDECANTGLMRARVTRRETMSDLVIPAGTGDGTAERAKAPKPSLGVQVFQNTAAQLVGRVAGIFLSAGTSILLARF